MKKDRREQTRLSKRCEAMFYEEVKAFCKILGFYSDTMATRMGNTIFSEFNRKRFKCHDERDFMYFNANIIHELVRKALSRNLKHFLFLDQKGKRKAKALCRKAIADAFVRINADHKYVKYKLRFIRQEEQYLPDIVV